MLYGMNANGLNNIEPVNRGLRNIALPSGDGESRLRDARLEGTSFRVLFFPFLSIVSFAFLVGCGQKSGAAEFPSLSLLETGDGKSVKSPEGQGVVISVSARPSDIRFRPIAHLPKDLSAPIGLAYGVTSSGAMERHVLTLEYDETALPLGVDEAELVLGRVVENRWEMVSDSVVDVVSNTVRGGTLFSRATTHVYGLLNRPYPEFLNASFNDEVLSDTPSTGWVLEAHAPGEGGRRNIQGNNLFLIKDEGQVHSDPSLRQTVNGFIPGRTYVITGLVSGEGRCCEKESVASFGVAVDGQIILEWSRPLKEGFVPFSATLQATSASHEIAFIAERNGSPTAYFIDDVGVTPQRGFPLNVIKSGSGRGNVLSHPVGVDCGQTCSGRFVSGGSVTLVATAEPGSIFSGFSATCSEVPVCTLTLDAAKTVTATFSTASGNANLARLETRPDQSDTAMGLEPYFISSQTTYNLVRLGQSGFVTFLAEAEDSGAVIRIGEVIKPSGQPVRIYFNGEDTAVPILVTAQDGKTKQYAVRLCRWYCVNTPPKMGENFEIERLSLTKEGGVL